MVANGQSVLILYKVVNSAADTADNLFNAFSMPRGHKGPTLASVKQHCKALHGLSHLGPEGFHWRVCMEDKPAPGEEASQKTITWWDIQDENAVLPVKDASSSQLAKFFAPPKPETDTVTKATKGMFKAMSKAVAGADGIESTNLVSVVAFKLLDMVKMTDDWMLKNPGKMGMVGAGMEQAPQGAGGGRRGSYFRSSLFLGAGMGAPSQAPAQQRTAPNPAYTASAPPRAASAPAPVPPRPPSAPSSGPGPAQADLMGFGGAPAAPNPKNLMHTTSSPAAFGAASASNPNETRAQKLKREYEQKKNSGDLEWDPVEQRMVQKGSMKNGGGGAAAAASANKGAKIVGTKLDASSTVGKSAEVASAVHKRINDMKESQAKAVSEVRERESKKEREKEEEDVVRRKLEPKIKAWSEEHGKKKQLRALLGTLHTILWPDSGWKPVSIGDILEDGKVKKAYFKASRIVHPDKAGSLDPEKRFLAKRIFDALTQAKVDFDAGKK